MGSLDDESDHVLLVLHLNHFDSHQQTASHHSKSNLSFQTNSTIRLVWKTEKKRGDENGFEVKISDETCSHEIIRGKKKEEKRKRKTEIQGKPHLIEAIQKLGYGASSFALEVDDPSEDREVEAEDHHDVRAVVFQSCSESVVLVKEEFESVFEATSGLISSWWVKAMYYEEGSSRSKPTFAAAYGQNPSIHNSKREWEQEMQNLGVQDASSRFDRLFDFHQRGDVDAELPPTAHQRVDHRKELKQEGTRTETAN